MTIDIILVPPLLTDPLPVFDAAAFKLAVDLVPWTEQVNATALAMNLNSTNDVSVTSNSISKTEKTFTVTPGKSFQKGMYLVIADTTAPSTNSMFGQVTSYEETALVISILSISGSGTYANWTISQSSLGVSTVPVGTVIHSAASAAPAGYLKCNGAAISRSVYANLFAAIGTTYGAGDGATTFNVPELRGEFIRSLDDGRGIDSGRAIGTAQGDTMQGHKHNMNMSNIGDAAVYTLTSNAGGQGGIAVGNTPVSGSPSLGIASPISDGTNGSPRTGTETRPRNIALLACIKY